MNIDENDILFTNQYINTDGAALDGEISSQKSNEFKQYYKNRQDEIERRSLVDSLDKLSIRSMVLEEDTDANSLLTTNKFETNKEPSNQISLDNKTNSNKLENGRYTKEIKTYVNVDSRDRDKINYQKPNNFKIFLGKTFYNVKQIRLASIEFPNTNAVINSNNNKIYWRNGQDVTENKVDDKTRDYPVYSTSLRIGSYISSSLQTEIESKLSLVKRENGEGDFHYFLVTLDIDTDIVTFTSLTLRQLNVNPFSVAPNSGTIIVAHANHGYTSGETIYIVGAKTFGGIPSSSLNGPHTIQLIDANSYYFEINIKSGENIIAAGGNTVKSGKLAPFQLLFGENTNTIAQNIGFPNENSSQKITINISNFQNIYLAKITTMNQHTLTDSTIGTVCNISSPLINGNFTIIKILDTFTVLVLVGTALVSIENSGTLVYGTKPPIDISEIRDYDIDTVLITTTHSHNYTIADANNFITISGSTTTPNLDGNQRIFSVISPTQIVIQDNILDAGPIGLTSRGQLNRHKPLQTFTKTITNIIPGPVTTFICPDHGLTVGQRVRFYNIKILPSILEHLGNIYAISSIPDKDTFILDFETTSFDSTLVQSGQTYIGTSLVNLSFPNHTFNKITSISKINPTTVEIGTFLPHNLTTGNTVLISGTNTTPVIDTIDGYSITKIDNYTFTIPYTGVLTVPSNPTGILGLSNDFYLYGAESVGGFPNDALNNKKFTVYDILDADTITFEINNVYATSSENGGGDNLYISSLYHGFNGIQTNTKNDLLNRSINLEGENYVFLCCPQLATMMNTGSVKDIFARILLDQSPGSMVFSYLSNPKNFDTVPLNQLSELEFSIKNYDGSLYEFNDLDYSMVLEITEVVDTTDIFNVSSRRGVGQMMSSQSGLTSYDTGLRRGN